MFKRICFAMLFATVACGLETKTVQAQTTGTQTFTVTVPTSISITPPNSGVTLTHDATDNNQVFPPQAWIVRGNVGAGVNVNFTANAPFVHTENANFKRDLHLAVAVGASQGPAMWNVTEATDETDYAANKQAASVSVSSTGPGRANLNLTVSFITDEFGTFANGDYVSTITGTVAAN
jgi:hypothetical protein